MATLVRGVATPRSLAHRLRTPRATGYPPLLPAIVYVLALIGFPLVPGIWYSLTNTTIAEPGHLIGLQNLVDVARDPTFRLAARNTLVIGVVATAATITLSVALAYLMFSAFPGRGILRTLPWGMATFIKTDTVYQWGVLMAAAVLITVPVLLFFVIVQRDLVVGLTEGGVKT